MYLKLQADASISGETSWFKGHVELRARETPPPHSVKKKKKKISDTIKACVGAGQSAAQASF